MRRGDRREVSFLRSNGGPCPPYKRIVPTRDVYRRQTIQANIEPPRHPVRDEGEPDRAGADVPEALATDGPLRPDPQGPRGPAEEGLARRAALRQRRDPHGAPAQ